MLKMLKMIKIAQEGKYLTLHSVTLLWADSLFFLCVCVCVFCFVCRKGKKNPQLFICYQTKTVKKSEKHPSTKA